MYQNLETNGAGGGGQLQYTDLGPEEENNPQQYAAMAPDPDRDDMQYTGLGPEDQYNSPDPLGRENYEDVTYSEVPSGTRIDLSDQLHVANLASRALQDHQRGRAETAGFGR